jgi:hypothetical protein
MLTQELRSRVFRSGRTRPNGLESRRVCPMPQDVLTRVQRLQEAHSELPKPANLGRVIGMRRADSSKMAI